MPQREKVTFRSGDTECVAWHYPGTNGACLVMAAGLAVIKEAVADPFAPRLQEAGFGVLAFDYRRLGESGGEPRQVVDFDDQLEDFEAAIGCARKLPDVDPRRVAIWGFSASGGHVYTLACRHPELGAAIVHAGAADALHSGRYAIRHFTPGAALKLNALGLADRLGRLVGRDPILVPLSGQRGEVAAITTPDSRNGPRALNPDGRYDDLFVQKVDAWAAVRIGLYRPGRRADEIDVPLLVLEFEDDGVIPPGPGAEAAARAPRGEHVSLPGGHYASLLDPRQHRAAVGAMVDFLGRHLLDAASDTATSAPAAA